MTGRIRTVKPEWLEDELLAAASDEARVLSVALMLMADDYGRGRASIATIAAGAWRYQMERDDGAHAPEVVARASRALRELAAMRFVELYEVDRQRYFAIRTWSRHQKVDKPSKPRIPPPPATETPANTDTREPPSTHSRDARETLDKDSRLTCTSDLRPVPVPKNTAPLALASPVPKSKAKDQPTANESEAWRVWCEVLGGGKDRPILAGQLQAIRKALERYPVADVCDAFRGATLSDWHMNPEKPQYRLPSSLLSIGGANAGRIEGHVIAWRERGTGALASDQPKSKEQRDRERREHEDQMQRELDEALAARSNS